MRTFLIIPLGLYCCSSIAALGVGQEPDGKSAPAAVETVDVGAADGPPESKTWQEIEAEAIRSEVESYAKAFNAKSVDGLLAKWSPQGVYVSQSSGEEFAGHQALKAEFARILEGESPPKLALQTEVIDFISPNVAVERGVAVVTTGEESEETSYQAVYVKSEKGWLIDRVSEQELFIRPSHYEAIRGLEFLTGSWVSEGEEVVVEIDCRFTTNQNYLSRTYRVIRSGEIESSGLQLIGWDARKEQIRSWLFDSDGGFVHGEWSQHDEVWVCQAVATLTDGAAGSHTAIIRPLDADQYGWRKTNRVLDGELLPSTDELVFRRR